MSRQTENAGSCEHGMPIYIGCDDCTIGKMVDEINSLKAANTELEKANDRLCEQNTDLDAACAKLEADMIEAIATEREACALVAEQGFRFAKDGYAIADEIRARGEV